MNPGIGQLTSYLKYQ